MFTDQTDSSLVSQPHILNPPVTLAVSAKWFAYPERFNWIAEQNFALEYSPNPDAFELLPKHLDPFLNAGVRVRHHGFFPDYEIGDIDNESAERAMGIHLAALDALRGRGEQVITFHMNLTRGVDVDPEKVVENLAILVEFGRKRGITVSLENLKQGLTSHPETVSDWAEQSGAMITLDVGHAGSSERVQKGELTVQDFIDMFEDRLIEVHFYEKEIEQHYAPKDMTILGPIVDRLLQTDCAWWTIELEEFEDILQTRTLLIEYLRG